MRSAFLLLQMALGRAGMEACIRFFNSSSGGLRLEKQTWCGKLRTKL